MEPLYIGIDGGGTRTRAVVAGRDLIPRGRGASGPASAATTPVPRLLEAVREAVEDALETAGAAPSSVAALSLGLAGVESTGARARILAALTDLFAPCAVHLTTDARIALAGAHPAGPQHAAVVLIAGTGAVCFGCTDAGDEARAGGWGPLIGDEGSAYTIARKGLAAVVRALDGRGPHTLIGDLLFRTEGTSSPTDLLARLYRSGAGPADVAAYFPIMMAAARKGDPFARSLFEEASAELALSAVTVVKRLELESASFPVATVGGVFSAADLVLPALVARLASLAPGARVGPPAFPPEIGAIRLALEAERGA